MFRFKVKVPKCTATEHPADATMDIESLSWTVTPTIWQPERGRIEDFALTYKPGFPRESITLKCPKIPAIEAPLSLWYPAYVVTHKDQWEAPPGAVRSQRPGPGDRGRPDASTSRCPKEFSGELRLTGWEVQEAPLLARQTWSKKALGGKVAGRRLVRAVPHPRLTGGPRRQGAAERRVQRTAGRGEADLLRDPARRRAAGSRA